MMFRYSFNRAELSDMIENAIQKALDDGLRTKDIDDGTGRLVSTSEMGEEILKRIGE
jgi:3-isopropylmalate dehydrogenase